MPSPHLAVPEWQELPSRSRDPVRGHCSAHAVALATQAAGNGAYGDPAPALQPPHRRGVYRADSSLRRHERHATRARWVNRRSRHFSTLAARGVTASTQNQAPSAQNSFDEHLAQLGLVSARHNVDHKTGQLVVDPHTGELEVRNYGITALGRLLLKQAGVRSTRSGLTSERNRRRRTDACAPRLIRETLGR